ncbi:MAG: hypothetical protein MI742_16270 [Desulfobacterales bacterium]|nr:hypothetical protein [Desulfobacterales bacterium]
MKPLARIGLIGMLHATCYLWFIPKIVLPHFGSTGGKVAVACVVATSLFLVTLIFRKPRKKP